MVSWWTEQTREDSGTYERISSQTHNRIHNCNDTLCSIDKPINITMTSSNRHTATTVITGRPLFAEAEHHRPRRSNSSNRSSSLRVKHFGTTGKSTFAHSPMVMAMLTNNSLSNCQDVGKMMQECSRTSSHDQVCQTATRYMQSCLAAGTAVLGSGILDTLPPAAI
jgi:hypothetical protein